MKRKDYIKPETEFVDVICNVPLAASIGWGDSSENEPGVAGSRRRIDFILDDELHIEDDEDDYLDY